MLSNFAVHNENPVLDWVTFDYNYDSVVHFQYGLTFIFRHRVTAIPTC